MWIVTNINNPYVSCWLFEILIYFFLFGAFSLCNIVHNWLRWCARISCYFSYINKLSAKCPGNRIQSTHHTVNSSLPANLRYVTVTTVVVHADS